MADQIPYSDDSEPTLVSAGAYKALVDRVNVLSSMLVRGGSLKISNVNAVLDIGGADTSGHVPTAVTLCVDGVEVEGTVLFKETPP